MKYRARKPQAVGSTQDTRAELMNAADSLVRELLFIREHGRCYCCGRPADDVAHLFGRRYLRLRWDYAGDGNCHLLCRTCHTEDHNATLDPSYMDTFIERVGGPAADELIIRKQDVSPVKDYEIEEVIERLKRILEEDREGK